MKDRVQKWMQPLLKQYETYTPLKLLPPEVLPNFLTVSSEMPQNSGQCASEAQCD